jgi:hypothetical protein
MLLLCFSVDGFRRFSRTSALQNSVNGSLPCRQVMAGFAAVLAQRLNGREERMRATTARGSTPLLRARWRASEAIPLHLTATNLLRLRLKRVGKGVGDLVTHVADDLVEDRLQFRVFQPF